MATHGERPQARPLFRKLALGMAIVLFLLAAIFGIALTENTSRWMSTGVCLFLGFVMLTIGKTGLWPPPKR
jgi:hypothetical protein